MKTVFSMPSMKIKQFNKRNVITPSDIDGASLAAAAFT